MSTGKSLLLIGGGGHCKSVIDCVLKTKEYDRVGIIDNDKECLPMVAPLVGNDGDLSKLKTQGWTHAFISVGSIGSTDVRRKLYSLIKKNGYSIPIIKDPSSIIADNCVIEEGVFIGKGVILNSESKVGKCSILNAASIVEHDCSIGDFSHISTGTVLCGNVSVGNDAHIGAGSVVRQGIVIGSNSLIGAGSVVVKDIPNNMKAYGNPCRVVE